MAQREWEPSLPWGVPRDTPPDAAPDRSGAVPWADAPPASHLYRFRYWDARDWPLIRKYGDFAGKSQLHVTFKEKDGSEGPEYWYFFADPDAGRAVFDKLAASPHPYSEVLLPLVIRAGVPYRRQSR